jgi:hypothetical protein
VRSPTVVLRSLALAASLLGACHHEPVQLHPKAGDLPPLPPASGTPIGYLIDSAAELKLRPDQLTKLRDIDASLAARDADLDTQLRVIEARVDEEENGGPPPARGGRGGRRQAAPDAKTVRHHETDPATGQSDDAKKLHAQRNAGDVEALKQAWGILDEPQRATAHRLLDERGISTPGSGGAATPPAAPPGDGEGEVRGEP